ncbi:Glutaredoxin [Macleaya cordata]|uniref:Glutaredoxin n=1 Tax=Macleaya cordata TaxID=56857 RepID=A0A200QD72_MACCD|nr:Glutaredoxin [Macleaya cordata]
MMQGVRGYQPLTDGGGFRLELTSSTAGLTALTIDVAETVEKRIERLIEENPVIIFSKSSCCMCHVMKRLLSNLGCTPTVIELEEGEMGALPAHDSSGVAGAPAVFIGGTSIGGLESLMALHLSGNLVPKLNEVGAVWI